MCNGLHPLSFVDTPRSPATFLLINFYLPASPSFSPSLLCLLDSSHVQMFANSTVCSFTHSLVCLFPFLLFSPFFLLSLFPFSCLIHAHISCFHSLAISQSFLFPCSLTIILNLLSALHCLVWWVYRDEGLRDCGNMVCEIRECVDVWMWTCGHVEMWIFGENRSSFGMA